MEATIRKLFVFWLLFLASGCDKFEMRGFFRAYESVDERFEQSQVWNAAHGDRTLLVNSDNYLLYFMGDSHVGGTANLQKFFNDAIADGAIAAVMAGDLTTGHAEDFDTFYQQLPPADSLQLFPIAGNHDLYFHGWLKYYELFGSSTYTFTVQTPSGSDLYICLDSGGGTLGARQLEWLKETLAAQRGNYRRCILVTHVNLFRIRKTTSTNPLVEELQVLNDLCARYEVDMFITGHDHKRNVVQLGNTTHITMDALLDGFKQAGYMKLYCQAGELSYEFVNF